MIAHLKGKILHAQGEELVIDVAGVGYAVVIGHNHARRMGSVVGQEVSLCIQTEVKEDEIRLVGLESFEQRSLYQLFRGVSGIGPKAALHLVDQLSGREIAYAFQTQDPKVFTKVSGIGLKTAQRILLELGGKLEAFASANLPEPEALPSKPVKGTLAQDAKSALMNLGFAEKEASNIIQKQIKPNMNLDELIRACLVELKR